MRTVGQLDLDEIVGGNVPSGGHDTHDSGLANERSVRGAMDNLSEQSWPERVDLCARVAQPGHLDDGRRAELQPGTAGKREQIETTGRDVFAELARADVEPLLSQLIEELGMQQVDLAEIGLRGISIHS